MEGEPDARPMGIGKGPKPPSYNKQTAVDVDTGLIIHHQVVSEPNDTRQLLSDGEGNKGHARRFRAGGGGRCWLLEWNSSCGLRG